MFEEQGMIQLWKREIEKQNEQDCLQLLWYACTTLWSCLWTSYMERLVNLDYSHPRCLFKDLRYKLLAKAHNERWLDRYSEFTVSCWWMLLKVWVLVYKSLCVHTRCKCGHCFSIIWEKLPVYVMFYIRCPVNAEGTTSREIFQWTQEVKMHVSNLALGYSVIKINNDS